MNILKPFSPPVTVIRLPKDYGSNGYGAKIDGDTIVIPYNKVFDDILENHTDIHKVIIPRDIFDALPDYTGW